MNFKSNKAYKKWLAYGHASGEFAKTPGHQSVSIKGKPKSVKHKNGGTEDPLLTAMMKARLAYANEFGNPAAQRMISPTNNPYKFDNGYIGTHYMSSIDNYAVPQIQDVNGKLVLGDFGPESNEAIRFDRNEDADYFAKHYKEISPAFKYEHGGRHVTQDITKNRFNDREGWKEIKRKNIFGQDVTKKILYNGNEREVNKTKNFNENNTPVNSIISAIGKLPAFNKEVDKTKYYTGYGPWRTKDTYSYTTVKRTPDKIVTKYKSKDSGHNYDFIKQIEKDNQYKEIYKSYRPWKDPFDRRNREVTNRKFDHGGPHDTSTPISTYQELDEVEIYGEDPQWKKDRDLYGKDYIYFYEAWNPKKWGLNDYSKYSSFNSAFRNARESNEKEFVYKGNRYSTKLIPKAESDLYHESKDFLTEYYKTQPYKKIDKNNAEYSFRTKVDKFFKKKYNTTWTELYHKKRKLEDKLKDKVYNNKEWHSTVDLMDKIWHEDRLIDNGKNLEYDSWYDANERSERLESINKPSYFSITTQKPKDMSEDGYWDPVNNKTFLLAKGEPGKLNTTYIHELSHKGDSYFDVEASVPPINIEKINKSPYTLKWNQNQFNYLSDPSEIEARKLATLFHLYKNNNSWKSGSITEESLNKLYEDYNNNKLPYDIAQLLELYGTQKEDLLKYLNSDYNYKNLKYGGSIPNIPTWNYPSKGTPIYRDTSEIPPVNNFRAGGFMGEDPPAKDYSTIPGVNKEKLTQWNNLNKSEPTTVEEAKLLAEAVGYTPQQAIVVAAQWALESGRGKHTGGDYNYFGIKSHNQAVRNRMSDLYNLDLSAANPTATSEYEDGKNVTTTSSFMNFANPIEAFLGHKAFLETNNRYADALSKTTSAEFAQGLQKAGYATAPNYSKLLRDIAVPVVGEEAYGTEVETVEEPVKQERKKFNNTIYFQDLMNTNKITSDFEKNLYNRNYYKTLVEPSESTSVVTPEVSKEVLNEPVYKKPSIYSNPSSKKNN